MRPAKTSPNSEYAVPLRSTQIGRWPTSHIPRTLGEKPKKTYSRKNEDQIEQNKT